MRDEAHATPELVDVDLQTVHQVLRPLVDEERDAVDFYFHIGLLDRLIQRQVEARAPSPSSDVHADAGPCSGDGVADPAHCFRGKVDHDGDPPRALKVRRQSVYLRREGQGRFNFEGSHTPEFVQLGARDSGRHGAGAPRPSRSSARRWVACMIPNSGKVEPADTPPARALARDGQGSRIRKDSGVA